MLLLAITLVVNFLGLAATLWLGLFIVTRSPRSAVAWLTGLTLWSVGGQFLYTLIIINPPPPPADVPDWVLRLAPFWQPGATAHSWGGWLQGWQFAVVLWHHVTLLMRPGGMNSWRWTRVAFGYLATAAAVLIQIFAPQLFASGPGDPLFLSGLRPGPLTPFFQLLMLVFIVLSLINLSRSARAAPAEMPRKQLILLTSATLIAGLAAPLFLAAVAVGVRVPRVTMSLMLGLAVILLVYGVARYSALVEGRVIRRDLLYNLAAVSLVTLLYLAVTGISVRLYRAPGAAFTFVLMLAIVTHSLVDVTRGALDSIFYRSDARLRANLRRAARLPGELASLDETLAHSLGLLCGNVGATFGLLWLFEPDGMRLAATHGWHAPDGALPAAMPAQADLLADDCQLVPARRFPPPLAEAAALVPLYADDRQVGAVLLGRPANSAGYSQADLDLVLDPADRLADLIRDSQRETEHLAQIAKLLEPSKAKPSGQAGGVEVKTVEDALRHLSDYAHLGQHPLASLAAVDRRLGGQRLTHLERGKAVYQVLDEAIERLRPAAGRPSDPPAREWHPYLILHDAYLEDVPNREIMSRLYISDATFSRTRRAALRAIARSLDEMEAALA